MEEEDPLYYYNLPQDKVLEESAPLLRRLGAFIIDLLAFNLLFYSPFMQSFQLISGLSSELLTFDYLLLHPEIVRYAFSALIASTVIFCFYLGLSEYVFGQTIGEYALGLWVKGKPGIWGFIARNLVKSTFIILLPVDLLGFIKGRQRLIDQALGVNVLYTNKLRLSEGFI
jgi:hypothetical protein